MPDLRRAGDRAGVAVKRSVWFDAAARIVDFKDRDLGPITTDPCSRQCAACYALKSASCFSYTAQRRFDYWFKPDRGGIYWWRDPQTTDADQEARRLALCFMHWIEQTEGES